MLKRKKLIRFEDVIIMDIGFYGYIVYLIILKRNFRLEKLKGMVSYPLIAFNSKNVDKAQKKN